MKIDDLYQELIDAAVAQMDAPLPSACGSTRACTMAGGCPVCLATVISLRDGGNNESATY